MEIKTSFGSR